ncbi:hypothetical protein [Legionella impletisoli]|uniref:Uncharacterized protein n=1 Tax=Legionella impletisoli TaxID=343510 RepID=A0A917JN17_9GAMM|nr:hypothetical protein [Legionella impletisoli]GGI78284.1 hypothetical protein GCM10007966_03730 [Legionella impletisoli]
MSNAIHFNREPTEIRHNRVRHHARSNAMTFFGDLTSERDDTSLIENEPSQQTSLESSSFDETTFRARRISR